MPGAEDTAEFVLSLRLGPGGAPSGSLRAVGDQNEAPFEGWIGLITELGFTANDSHGNPEGGPSVSTVGSEQVVLGHIPDQRSPR